MAINIIEEILKKEQSSKLEIEEKRKFYEDKLKKEKTKFLENSNKKIFSENDLNQDKIKLLVKKLDKEFSKKEETVSDEYNNIKNVSAKKVDSVAERIIDIICQ